jgi:PASTA domain
MSARVGNRGSGHIWSRLNPGTLLLVVLPLVLVAAGLTGAVAGSRIDLRSGAAWLASAQGQIILVSGSAARRVASFPVSAPGQDLSVVQTADAVFLVNRTASSVTRMDAATFSVTPPVPVPGSAGRLQALVGGGRLHVLDGQSGLVLTLDPITMTPIGSPRALDTQVDPGGAVVDDSGRIWVVDADSGVIRWLDDSSVGTGMTVANAELVVAGGAAVAVEGGRAHWLSSSGQAAASVDLGALPGEVPAVTGAPDGRLLVAIPGRALVRTCGRGGCDSAVGRLTDAGARFGQPQLLGDVVLVPDLERGTIHLVRPGQGAEFAAAPVMPANTEFEVIVHEGFAFYNAVGNERAGVLRINGDFDYVQKYEPEDPNKGLDTLATSVSSSEAPTTPSETSSAVPSTIPASPTVIPTTRATATTVRPTRTTAAPTTSATSTRVSPPASSPPSSTVSSAAPVTPVITDLRCTPTNPAVGDSVSCTASETAAGPGASWIWHVRDAVTGNETVEAPTQPAGQPYVFTLAARGSYTVELTVNNLGVRSSATFALVSKVTIPDVRGKTQAEASAELQQLGLSVSSTSRRSRTPAGTALGTEPATEVLWNQRVALVVSSGPINLGNLGPQGVWTNSAGVTLPWNGNEGDDRGFVRPVDGFGLASGNTAPAGSFETHPQWVDDGRILGQFTLPTPISSGERFSGVLDFRAGAGGGVTFSVSARMPSGSVVQLSPPRPASPGFPSTFDIILTPAAGATVLILTVDANGSSSQDWAIWTQTLVG